MPIRACAEKLRKTTSPLQSAQAVTELLQQPPDLLRQSLTTTWVGDLATVLYRASLVAHANGPRLSTELFSALGPANVLGHLQHDLRGLVPVLQAAAVSSPQVSAEVVAAARVPGLRGLSLLDHANRSPDRGAKSAVRLLLQNADRAQRPTGPAHSAGSAPAGMESIRQCHESLTSAPGDGERHIRRMLQGLESMTPEMCHLTTALAHPDMVVDILSAAAQVEPTPEAPTEARSLVGRVFDTLPFGTLMRCVELHPEHTLKAAATDRDVRSLGRVFDAAVEAGSAVCVRVSELARDYHRAPFEQVLSRGTAREVADLLRMASLADPKIGEKVLMRAADHGSDPLRRLEGSPEPRDREALALAAARCGLTVAAIDGRRQMMRGMRDRQTEVTPPSPVDPSSLQWGDVHAAPAPGEAPHFSRVDWTVRRTPPGPSREPGPQR